MKEDHRSSKSDTTERKYSMLLKRLHDICLIRLVTAGDFIEPKDFNWTNGKYWDNEFNSQFRSQLKRENIQNKIARMIIEKPSKPAIMKSASRQNNIITGGSSELKFEDFKVELQVDKKAPKQASHFDLIKDVYISDSFRPSIHSLGQSNLNTDKTVKDTFDFKRFMQD